jgi:hypothetical protein
MVSRGTDSLHGACTVLVKKSHKPFAHLFYDEEVIISVVGVPDIGMAGMNVLLLG